MDLEALKERLATISGMPAVEALISEKLHSDAPLLTEISSYLLNLGGKRIRPILTLIVGQLYATTDHCQPSRELIDIAAGIELIHMATLLHDDIIDRSPLRRHQQSPYLKYGADHTLLTGDFLLTRAFSLCARLDRHVIDATERACIELTEGEILEVPTHIKRPTLDESLTIARKKTAALFRLACESAAHICKATENELKLLATFGENIGIAFQILDDLLDVASTTEQLGKQSGLDIYERKPSIVNVLWLESGDPLATLLTHPAQENELQKLPELLDKLRLSDVLITTKNLAMQYTNLARTTLEQLCTVSKQGNKILNSESVTLLLGLTEYLTKRVQ